MKKILLSIFFILSLLTSSNAVENKVLEGVSVEKLLAENYIIDNKQFMGDFFYFVLRKSNSWEIDDNDEFIKKPSTLIVCRVSFKETVCITP